MLLGIIPCPKEPKFNINAYLKPVVYELILAWNGISVKDDGVFGYSLYRMALVCLSSDIPATRKCGGFVSFSFLRKLCIFIYIIDSK